MQKSAVLTFSAHDKDALLDEFREIVDAGELRSRTDTRWDSACDRLSDRYGWHLDDWKRIGRDQMGQKCNSDRGWYGLKGACKRGKKSGDNKSAIRESKQALAAKLRKKKGFSEIKDRDGKNNPVTYAFIPGNQKSSTAAARRTGPKSGVSSGGRLGNIQRTEEKRQQIRSGVFPGKTITERFEQADRIRDKYGGMLTPKTKGAAYLSDPRTSNLMRTHEGVRETSYEYYFPSEADGSRQGLKVADVERKAFKRFQLLKKGLAEPADDIATDIDKKRLEQIGKLTQIEAAKQNADRRRVVSRAEIDNAPVRSTNERSSKQPRKRGRSVD